MDTNLIKLVNKLQDAFATVGVHNPVDLPQIVVIGSQSSGKSSVLENIVGKAFLPRGTGIVTRRPLVLQLLNRPSSRPASQPNNSKSNGVGGDGGSKVLDESNSTPEEWGEFLHIPGRKFTDFNKIRDEIVRDTEEKTGKGVGISPQPINLRVYSPYVLTLTLVDLPGLTKVPVGDQPKDIERQIREMILKYISKTNSIILAVTGANTDLANSDGLKLARDVDPDGMRSIGVLTKIDLMDPGTDVVDILAGRVIPLRLGYVPVVNRGQKDVESSLAIRDTLEKEREFFENHPSYKSKAQYCGTPFLSRKLNMILMHHIRTTLPEIKTKIAAGLAKYQAELSQLGDEMLDGSGGRGNFILQITTDFCHEFRTVLEGTAMDLTSNELSGGARISFVFHELFANGIRAIDPLDQVKDSDIRTIMYNSSGSKPALFVGTQAFEVLVKQQIKRLEEPSLKCVTLVFDEMVRILGQLLQKHVFKRFPSLKERVYVVVVNYLKRAIVPTNKLCSDIISAESCYINTGHPDFISGHKASSMVLERMKNQEQKGQKVGIPIGSTAGVVSSPAYPGGVSSILEGDSNVGGFFGSFFQRQKPKKGSPQSSTQPVLEAPPLVLKAQGNLSEREHMETEVIKLLLNNYFNIVKRTVADLVPKAIMLHLVQNAKENLQRELLSELYKSDVSDVLLRESEFTVQRRNECRKMIDALKRADEIVSNV